MQRQTDDDYAYRFVKSELQKRLAGGTTGEKGGASPCFTRQRLIESGVHDFSGFDQQGIFFVEYFHNATVPGSTRAWEPERRSSAFGVRRARANQSLATKWGL